MNLIAQKLLSASPLAVAALLLLARRLCVHLALPAPDVPQILAATNASRSAAYELVDALSDAVVEFEDYLERHSCSATELVGKAALTKTFQEIPDRDKPWQTLLGEQEHH